MTPRLRRPLLAAGIATLVVLSGCAGSGPYGSEEFGAEQEAAREFMYALEAGDATAARALTTGDLGLRIDVQSDVFYGATEARPEDATIVSAVALDDKTVHVDVDYSLGGDEREIQLAFERGVDEPRISGWLFPSLSVDAHTAGGELIVSDAASFAIDESSRIVLLPGRYAFRYEGPGPASGESFWVDFPVDDELVGSSLPPGMGIEFTSLVIDQGA